jgi:hypothetical protein
VVSLEQASQQISENLTGFCRIRLGTAISAREEALPSDPAGCAGRRADTFQSDIHVTEAYLVRLRYSETVEPKVALCVAAGDEVRSEVVESVGSEFRKMFKTTESLDILFLSREQQKQIKSVACPFYQQRTYRI